MNEFFDKNKALQIILNKAFNKGISQSKLIEGIYDYSHFNRMCNGKENIKVDILVLCCLKLDISFDQVIQESKSKTLLELDEFYNHFEIIRLRRNYNELSDLYQHIISNNQLHKLNKYKQLSKHLLAIIEAKRNQNFNIAKRLLEEAFEISGYSIEKYRNFDLTKEQIEILIDYSICCFSLRNTEWYDILVFLTEKANNYTDEYTFDCMYPKIIYNISTMCLIEEDYKTSIKYCDEAIQFCRDKNNFIYLPYLYYNSACCFSMIKDYTKSKECLENCRSIFKLQNKLEEFQKVYQLDYEKYFSNSDFAI